MSKGTGSSKRKLSAAQRDELLAALEARFEKNKGRHKGLAWSAVREPLVASQM